jgi:hypothetical protein
MKLPPYTLVRRPGRNRKRSKAAEKKLIGTVGKTSPELARAVRSLNPQFRRSLLTSTAGRGAGSSRTVKSAFRNLERSVKEVQRAPHVYKVGLWDVSSQVGRLPAIIAAMNAAQPTFAFFELQAAVPAGLISRPEHVEQWARNLTGAVRRAQKNEFRSNVIFEDFYVRAELIRKDFGINYLVGIVPHWVASEDETHIYWNSFAAEDQRIMLTSTIELYKYSARADRPFEVAVAVVVVAILLASINPRADFHEETRGCLFDKNRQHATIVKSIAKPTIEPSCMSLISAKYRESAAALVRVLNAYRRPSR